MPRIPEPPPAARRAVPRPAAADCPTCGWFTHGPGSARAAKAHCAATGHGVAVGYVRAVPIRSAAPVPDRRHGAVTNRVLNALCRLDRTAFHVTCGPPPAGETTADIAGQAGVTPARAWTALRRLLRLGLVRRRVVWRPAPETGG